MSASLQSGFLNGPNGALHLSVWRPATASRSRRWVLLVPPFAEEMNKCRPMMSRLAARLAQEGVTVVLPDLSGTGDSSGDFADATWAGWRADLGAIADWCTAQGVADLVFWGVRLGCLLALDTLQDVARVRTLVMWQPALNGRLHLNQFLRLRVAAQMMQDKAESAAALRDRLHAGESLEIAGYELSAGLFQSLEAVSAAELSPPDGVALVVHEVVADPDKPLLPVTCKQMDAWRAAGVQCEGQAVPGSPFWLSQEIGFAPALLDAARDVLRTLPVALPDRQDDPGTAGAAIALADTADSVQSLLIDCAGVQLPGQLHRPETPGQTGVLVVVGGPQYRVGSHRQFVHLARALGERGLPVLRFDYRGLGDAAGELRGFEFVDADIRAALDAFQRECPHLTRVVLWGLCDAATAAACYAQGDPRVHALVLLNPWVYSPEGAARAYIKHYYLQRLFSADLWRKVLRGQFRPGDSLRSVAGFLRTALGREGAAEDPRDTGSGGTGNESPGGDLVGRMAQALGQFSGPVLLLLSGNDLTAAEFEDAAAAHTALGECLQDDSVTTRRFPGADHTFATREWSAAVEQATAEFVLGL